MGTNDNGQAVQSGDLLDSLTRKVAIYEKALRQIAKSTHLVEGDYTYNQTYESPTSESYTAKNALREANAHAEGSGASPDTLRRVVGGVDGT